LPLHIPRFVGMPASRDQNSKWCRVPTANHLMAMRKLLGLIEMQQRSQPVRRRIGKP
jgi:hypothetical protein